MQSGQNELNVNCAVPFAEVEVEAGLTHEVGVLGGIKGLEKPGVQKLD